MFWKSIALGSSGWYGRQMRRIVVLGLAVGLLGAGPAGAGQRKITYPNTVIARAIGASYDYWGTSLFDQPASLNQCRTLRVRADVPDGGTMVAYSTYKPFGSHHCIIGVSTHFAGAAFASEPSNWVNLCRVVIHEYGHLLGLSHSHDNTSIMWFDALALTIPTPQACVSP